MCHSYYNFQVNIGQLILILVLEHYNLLRPPGLCPGLPGWSGTRKLNQEGKTNLNLLEQEIVSGSGIS